MEKIFLSYAKYFHCSCHATWLPCKTSLPVKGSAFIRNTASLYLFVLAEPPKISLSSMQGSYREGSYVNVSCTATGIPQPDVTWIRDGTVTSSGKGAALLNFDSVRKTDDGCYLCRANNTADTISNHTIILVYRK